LITEKGFTLIEVLVATSILGLISLTILTTFGSGFAVYERVQSYGGGQADALLALEEMETRLRSLFPFSEIRFEGEAQKISFPAIIETIVIVDDEDMAVSSIGQISYYLDRQENDETMLTSGQKNYSQALSGVEAVENISVSLASVKDLRFRYYAFDKKEGTYVWKDSWPAEEVNLPTGVKIELTFQDGKREIPLVRTVMIPSVRVVDERIGSDDEDGEEEGEGQGNV